VVITEGGENEIELNFIEDELQKENDEKSKVRELESE